MQAIAAGTTLIDRIWPAAERPLVRNVSLALLGTALLWASAKAQVPMWPVPMTMQSYVVLVLGMAYGARLAAATVALYLIEGAAGLPVFSGTPERGIGLAYMMGPTGGYLVGFVLAAWAMGWLAERGWDRTIWRAGAAMALGTIILFAPGLAWLAVQFGWSKAIAVGLTPFIEGSILKLALAAATLPLAWRAVGRSGG
ncbi:MAG TPA: biotin transporter BioY [Alphaproteobacteria bacterium]|nr:biotin transporter BioY [Alphaproteobacteria bacterium]